jgi:hypothetical protein
MACIEGGTAQFDNDITKKNNIGMELRRNAAGWYRPILFPTADR